MDDLGSSTVTGYYFVTGLFYGMLLSFVVIAIFYVIFRNLAKKLEVAIISCNNANDLLSKIDKSSIEIKNSIAILLMKGDEGKKQGCCQPNQFIIPKEFAPPRKKKPGRPPKTIDVQS